MSLTTVRVAWRNLWRNRRRTALAATAIGLSVALVLVYDSVLRAYGDWLVETITGPMLGHAQAHAPEWRKDRAMDRTLRDVSRALAALRAEPEVDGATARVYAPALGALEQEGFALVVVGLDPEAEMRPTGLLARVEAPPRGRRVLVGKPLAERMGVRTGDTLALLGQGADGSLANDLYRVGGLVESPVDYVNRQAVLMDLAEAQALFGLADEAHEIVIRARNPDRAGELAARAAALPELRGAEVLSWRELAPEMLAIVELVRVAWVFVLLLVFLAAAAGVANTMLMATYERTREMGMLLALGAAPGRIVRLIVAESVVLGAVGSLCGAALGIGLVALTHRGGVDYAALTGTGPSEISFAGLKWSMRLFPSLAAADVARAVAAVMATSLLASAWPAVRAARLQPARALRE